MSADLRKQTLEIVDKLDRAYPEAHQELEFSTAFELLIATILAAQCTDVKVNEVTKSLFKKYPDPAAYLRAADDELRSEIAGITFAGNKAKFIKNCCKMLVHDFGGQVPNTAEDLVKLQGVGRKTANIVLANAMGIPAIGVDTHTIRVPNRLGWVNTKNPIKLNTHYAIYYRKRSGIVRILSFNGMAAIRAKPKNRNVENAQSLSYVIGQTKCCIVDKLKTLNNAGVKCCTNAMNNLQLVAYHGKFKIESIR